MNRINYDVPAILDACNNAGLLYHQDHTVTSVTVKLTTSSDIGDILSGNVQENVARVTHESRLDSLTIKEVRTIRMSRTGR
jgi:hypothetical protein